MGTPPHEADGQPAEIAFESGPFSAGGVVRVGDTVRRPRDERSDLVAAVLLHLESVGFDGAPRVLGEDDQGRQVLSFVPGTVTPDPPWIGSDQRNAEQLGALAELLRRAHDALADFVAPAGVAAARPLVPGGPQWNHGDAHYGNVVWDGDRPIALIDWEYCALGDRIYDPVSTLVCAALPRPDRDDTARRESVARRTLDAIAAGYRFDDEQYARAPAVAAAFFDDAATFVEEYASDELRRDDSPAGAAAAATRYRFIADWWRTVQL